MPEHSAGILMFRRTGGALEVLLVHPGGPFWAKKDEGAWSIPKGLYAEGEDPLAAALRELEEETGCAPPAGRPIPLGRFEQPSGKVVAAWALEGDFDPEALRSNTFTVEWPPRSGRTQAFPEVDRAAWLAPDVASRKILKGQAPIIAALLAHLGRGAVAGEDAGARR